MRLMHCLPLTAFVLLAVVCAGRVAAQEDVALPDISFDPSDTPWTTDLVTMTMDWASTPYAAENPNATFVWDIDNLVDPNAPSVRLTANGTTATYTFSEESIYLVTLTALDQDGNTLQDGVGNDLQSEDFVISLQMPPATDPSGVGQGSGTSDPDSGYDTTLSFNKDGYVELDIGTGGSSTAKRAANSMIETDFGDPFSVNDTAHGLVARHQYSNIGIYVATVSDTSSGTANTQARQQISIQGQDIGSGPPANVIPPINRNLPCSKLTGKVNFVRNKTSAETRAAQPKQKNDTIALVFQLTLPGGLNPSPSQPLYLGVGNLLAADQVANPGSQITVDPKGRCTLPQGSLYSKVSVKYPHLKKGATTTAGQTATVTVQITGPGLSALGLDTEGISATPGTQNRSIQLAAILAGVAYTNTVKVLYKVAPTSTGDAGVFSRSGD